MVDRIDYVDDWKARLRSRLYTQWRDATSWVAWCDEVLGPQFDDLEAAGQTLLTLLDIDESEGVQLDNIGRIVGQPRNSVDDATYRLYLSARILANKSDGSVEDIFKVMRALFGQDDTKPAYQGGWVKQFAIRINAALTRANGLIATDFLTDSKEAGARGLLEWQESADNEMFGFWHGAALATGIVGGAAIQQVYVSSTSGYAGAGNLTVDDDLVIAYASHTATSFHASFGTVPTYSHAAGSPVSRQSAIPTGGTATGLDNGDFAAAKQA